MPWQPDPPPLLTDENANALGRWAQQQLQQLAAALENPDITHYNVLHVEPEKPREGQVVVADGTDWDPGNGAGQYMYLNGAWVFQRSGPEPNSYGTITDGTTPAPAEVAGDTFKLRGEGGVKVITTNDDVTHGDNALFTFDLAGLTSAAPALGDLTPFGDVSNADASRRTTYQLLLDLIGALAIEGSPDFAADFLALFDASGAVAKKVAMTNFASRTLISTTAMTSGTSVNITVPSGYRDVEVILVGVSLAAGGSRFRIRASEDAGSTFLTANFDVRDSAGNSSGQSNNPDLWANDSTAGEQGYWSSYFKDYRSSVNKWAKGQGFRFETGVFRQTTYGGHVFASTAPIDLININCSGSSFDAGSAELWGIN